MSNEVYWQYQAETLCLENLKYGNKCNEKCAWLVATDLVKIAKLFTPKNPQVQCIYIKVPLRFAVVKKRPDSPL